MCEYVTTETSLNPFRKKTYTKNRLMNIIKNSDGLQSTYKIKPVGRLLKKMGKYNEKQYEIT